MSDIPALLERFRRGPEVLAMVLTGVFGEEEDFTVAPGKWSVRQIVAHLADAEMVGAHRMRQVIAEDNPLMPAMNQDLWAERLDYSKRKLSPALEAFRRTRAENFELLKDLPEATFARTGQHSERGTVTLLDLLRTYAEHAEKHVQHIQSARAAFKESKTKIGDSNPH